MSIINTKIRIEDMFAWRPAWRSNYNPKGYYFWSRAELKKKFTMAEHQPLNALLLFLNLAVLIVTVSLAIVASVDDSSNVFERSLGHEMNGEDSNHHATPAAWTFQYIWIVIYLWQFAWIFYSLTLIFRINKYTDSYLYADPSILPAAFNGIYILHLTIAIAWLFTYDNQYYVGSFVCLAAMALTLYICLFFSVFLLWHYQNSLSVSEMWANVILVHNGLALYATWMTIAMLLGFRTMLVETFDVKSQDAATTILAILLLVVMVYPPLEMWISKKRLRYVITPYLTVIIAVAGMIDSQDWDDAGKAYAVLKIVIMALTLIVTIAKFLIIGFRVYKSPTKIDTCRNQ